MSITQRSTIHHQHGADRALLGLSRDGCRNADQRTGYDSMNAQIVAFRDIANSGDGDPASLCEWANDLQRRLEQAEARRDYAIALAGVEEPAIAAGALFNVTLYAAVEVYA